MFGCSARKVRFQEFSTTSLALELERMEEAMNLRLSNHTLPQFPKNGNDKMNNRALALQMIKKHSRQKVSFTEWAKVEQAVDFSVEHDIPIYFAFMWACSGMAKSPLKFQQNHMNYPRLGDVWAFSWFKSLNEKIKKVHSPGIKLLVIDEIPLLALLGWTQEELARRHLMMKKIAEIVCPDLVEIVELPTFGAIADRMQVAEPSPAEIFSVIVSQDIPISAHVVDYLYKKREKPWEEIRQAFPPRMWQKAIEIRTRMSKIGQARKETDFVSEYLCGIPHIDACIVEKGRWCPDIWSLAFPQHGGTVLETDDSGRFSVQVVPEYRLVGQNEPVYINTAEFDRLIGQNGRYDDYVFYWKR